MHRQWVPLNSKVLNMHYNPGKYFIAFKEKASLDNEHTSILFKDTHDNPFRIKQIAGFIARRIINYMEIEKFVSRGERLGFIRFGSRTDLIMPSNIKLNVKLGEKVKGGETIIGEI